MKELGIVNMDMNSWRRHEPSLCHANRSLYLGMPRDDGLGIRHGNTPNPFGGTSGWLEYDRLAMLKKKEL